MKHKGKGKYPWRHVLLLVLLLSAMGLQGCLIPRAVGKTVGGVVRGTGKVIGAAANVVTAPLK